MTKKILTHQTLFYAGHDCIRFNCKFGSQNCKPKSGGSHGIGGLSIVFSVKGEHGAVQFVVNTGWLPLYSAPNSINVRDINLDRKGTCYPADLGYHSKKPMYDDQPVMQESCEHCDGEPCYYDGSCLNANDAMYALCNGGDAALWEFLEGYYLSVFEDADYPTPAEYAQGVR